MGEAQRDEIAKLEALYAANPEGRVFTHLAEAYRKAGNLDRAREILEEGLSRHPDSGTAYVVLGRVAYDSDHPEEARDAFGRALDLDGGNLVAHRYLGELALARGDREGARRHFEELLARNPTDESLLGRLRELSEPVFEAGPAAGDAPALVEDAEPGDGMVAEAEVEDSWTLPSEGFGDEPGAGDALPTLDLEPAADGRAGDPGAGTDPWSWDAAPGEPTDFEELDEFGTIEGLEDSDWDEAGADAELPELEGLEPMQLFDASLDEEDAVEPATWLADVPEAPEDEAFDLRGFEPKAASFALEPVPIDDSPTADSPSPEWPTADAPGDDGGQVSWRPYAVGEEAVADAQAEAGAVEASATWPSEPEGAPGAGLLPGRPDDVMTETIAELYLTQGFPGRAADVYRSLLQRHPDDGRLQERLAEAERQATPATPVSDPEEGGEDWAGTADSAFTGGSSAAVGEATPYAWGGVAEESPAEPTVEQAAPIAGYFQSLLQWRADAKPEAERVLEPEAERVLEPEAEPVPEPEAELVLEPEVDLLPEPELVLEEPPSGTEDFGGWTPDMLLDPEPEAASDRMPWETTEPASLAAPEDAAAVAEFGSAGEGEGPAGSGAEPAAQAPSAGPEPPEEEDEDLEMFRSWLQSLKK